MTSHSVIPRPTPRTAGCIGGAAGPAGPARSGRGASGPAVKLSAFEPSGLPTAAGIGSPAQDPSALTRSLAVTGRSLMSFFADTFQSGLVNVKSDFLSS